MWVFKQAVILLIVTSLLEEYYDKCDYICVKYFPGNSCVSGT
jgi:hypothetical protein